MYGSGGLQSDIHGQLALMDALIFFAAATLVSSIALADVMPDDHAADPFAGADVHEMLRVLLSASIGEEVIVSAGEEIRLPQDTSIGDCLYLELTALDLNHLRSGFASMESAIARAMAAIAGKALDPHIIASVAVGQPMGPVLAIPGMPANPIDAAAASTVIPRSSEGSWLLTLVLAPAALPEVGNVSGRHLDPALRVRLSL